MSDKDFVIIDEEDHKEDGKDSTIAEKKETSVTAQGDDSGDDDEYEKYCLMCQMCIRDSCMPCVIRGGSPSSIIRNLCQTVIMRRMVCILKRLSIPSG